MSQPGRRTPILYNTNGFAFHRLEDAVRILAAQGYDGVALTPDVHHLDPLRASEGDIEAFGRLLRETGLSVVIETGARFVLDPGRKHRPTLLDEPREASRRLDFLKRCTDLAAAFRAPVVSTWSGAAPAGLDPEEALDRLARGLSRLCVHAAACGVRVGFEPEPGMAVETVEGWSRVREAVGHPALGLTLDVGHCLATREGDPARILRRHAAEIVVLQVDDHRPGRHDHLMFGEGEVVWADVAAAVRESGWSGPVEVELSRHSSEAPSAAAKSLAFLRPLFP
ncbi:MAG TPA: sugar phosphate isomerase/epimerase family protein [Planctomycetota bacterium]|nr:sugar phosphate isomerase/epimerase family protein [Planctomycetota bacterium]